MELVRRVGLSPNIRKKQLSKGKVFGVPLDVLIERQNNSSGIPDIVFQCAEHIKRNGLNEEGLFRISGNRRLIDQLHSEYDNGSHVDLGSIHDISVVTSVFKSFFRELPQPLVPELVSEEILRHAENRKMPIDEFVSKLRLCCTLLPPSNLKLLSYLCSFLYEVGQHVKDTKMTDSSLAIVFGPNLFRIVDDLEALQKQPAITRAMSALITYHQQVFGRKSPENNLKPPENVIPKNRNSNNHSFNSSSRVSNNINNNAVIVNNNNNNSSSNDIIIESGNDNNINNKVTISPVTTIHLPESIIRVESSGSTPQPYFILPAGNHSNHGNTVTMATKLQHLNNKENITDNNKVEGRKKDWDDSWLSSLTQDSPSPETDDILARSHDSLSSMSPLTGSGNISVQLSLHQTIKECVYDMLIPAPNTSDHSFNVFNNNPATSTTKPGHTLYTESVPGASKQEGYLRRKGPKPDYHSNRNSTVLTINNLMSNSDIVPHSPTPSPPLSNNRRSSDGMFSFDYNPDSIKQLECVTKDRASPPKRRQMSRPRNTAASNTAVEGEGPVPKLNLNKLENNSRESLTSVPSCLTDTTPTKVSPSDNITSLANKISLLKRQVHAFDKNFEKINGRLPVGNDRKPISAVIRELNDLKRLLYDAKSVQSSNEASMLTVLKNQFEAISDKMEEKRRQAGRPTDLSLMSRSQLMDEKLCIQKALLYFEETYGRPKTKEQKDTMRPIYDRYRKVKIALNKATSSSEWDKTPNNNNAAGLNTMGDTWNITLGGSSATSGMELIKLPPEQLHQKLEELQDVKKVLRKTLRDFEKGFQASNGRKVLKDDRGPRENEYNEYKKVKAKIRLIETLIKRSDGSHTI